MKKRLILSIIAMITVLLLLSACGADEITAPQDTTIPQDTTTSNVILSETTPAETTPVEVAPAEDTTLCDMEYCIDFAKYTTFATFFGDAAQVCEFYFTDTLLSGTGYICSGNKIADFRVIAVTGANGISNLKSILMSRNDQSTLQFNESTDDDDFFKNNYLIIAEFITSGSPFTFDVKLTQSDEHSITLNVQQKGSKFLNKNVEHHTVIVEIPKKFNNQQIECNIQIVWED